MEQILKVLETNARTSLEELAAMTGKTVQEVAAYMDECEEKHIINGYRTLVDWERAGVADVQALIDLRVTPRRDFGFDEIAARLADFSEVDSVLLMSGLWRACCPRPRTLCCVPIRKTGCCTAKTPLTNGSANNGV